MKKVCLLILLLCALPLFAALENEILIFPEPGCDVGNLKWGMTVEEVQAKLGGKLKVVEPLFKEEEEAKYKISGIVFEEKASVYYEFKDGALISAFVSFAESTQDKEVLWQSIVLKIRRKYGYEKKGITALVAWSFHETKAGTRIHINKADIALLITDCCSESRLLCQSRDARK